MGESNWDEMLGIMIIAILGTGVWAIDDGDCGVSTSSATAAVLMARLCFLPKS
jgi:hypothetical protein